MSKKQKKKKFEVEETETIDDCLNRIAAEGYIPVRRMEEPVFQEVTNDGKTEHIPVKQRIIFEATLQ
ncbi:NETI motif-containing protein [Salibacterium salarium]|uniref:NETI motif-containing protein n=1 Tax=Salibacterium salarium TaxID=284579 RepID=A0A428N001_9BACI|nr:NETI motif-containing protein [Salibacterium salarium]RSL31735.1 NETI motif-containing protein [Salibacterium salarium]